MHTLLLYMFLITFQSIIATSEICLSFDDCYNCTGYNHIQSNKQGEDIPYCTWNNGICEPGTQDKDLEFWWQPSDKLCKANNKDLISKYCGETEGGSDDKLVKFSLNKVDGKYGVKNMVCAYKYKNFDKKNQIELTATLKLNTVQNTGGLSLFVEFPDADPATRIIQKEIYKVVINQCSGLTVYYGMKDSADDLPFVIEVTIKKNTISIALIITIVLSVIATVICGVIIFICSKKIAKRREQRRRAEEDENETENSERARQEEFKKKRLHKLHMILKEDLKPIEFQEKQDKLDNNCTICLNEFVKGDLISITKCKHVFHHNCIKKWLTKNIVEPKCPNCNAHIIDQNNQDQNIKNQEEINSELQRIHFQGNNPNVNNTSNMSNANINPHRFESSNINVLNNRNE